MPKSKLLLTKKLRPCAKLYLVNRSRNLHDKETKLWQPWHHSAQGNHYLYLTAVNISRMLNIVIIIIVDCSYHDKEFSTSRLIFHKFVEMNSHPRFNCFVHAIINDGFLWAYLYAYNKLTKCLGSWAILFVPQIEKSETEP